MIHTDFAALTDSKLLRQRAEEIFLEHAGRVAKGPGFAKQVRTPQVPHDLGVHQIELELQNEELRAARSAIEASRARYLDLYDLAPVGYCTLDSQGLILRGNLKAATLLGLPRAALLQRRFSNFIFQEDRCQYNNLHDRLLATQQPQDCELRMLDGHGIPFWTNLVTTFADSEDGVAVLRVVVTDISGRKQAESELRRAASVFTHSGEGIMITSSIGVIIDVNDAFCRITGYGRDEVIGQDPRMFKSGHQDDDFYRGLWSALAASGQWSGEVWNRRKSGELYVVMQTINAVPDPQGITSQYVALLTDISSLKAHQKELEHVAHFDALTGLPNRTLLADRLKQGMAQARRRTQTLAVVYLDLDGFKSVNDSHGHAIGDQLLVALASSMNRAIRDGDTLARIGGDEFVAVLLDVGSTPTHAVLLQRLLAAVCEAFFIGDLEVQVSASLGVAFYPEQGEMDADQLLRQADQAMYQAKVAGKNRIHLFDAQQDRIVRGQHESLARIRQAMANNEFLLHYQPKVNMRSGQIVGAEALIRWQHPELGLLAPASFLPAIEGHALAIELGEWVFDTTLIQVERWSQAGLAIPISVNVSGCQLQDANFVERLRKLLDAHPNAPASRLEVEVLETSALENIASVSQLIDCCRQFGVRFALDDFGTGYSSLTYLKRLPVAQIKIDQSFVRGMLDDSDDLAILEGVIALARTFRRQVIAEGVETAEHGSMLLQLGCELAQGYGIGSPMSSVEFLDWAASWKPDPAWHDLSVLDRRDLPLLFASVEHRTWVKDIEAFLSGKRKTAPHLDVDQCRFGAWLAHEGQARYGTHPLFIKLGRLHARAHTLATELLDLHGQGHPERATAEVSKLLKLCNMLFECVRMVTHQPTTKEHPR